MADKLYTVRELREVLKTSKDRILEMIASGQIVASNIGTPGGKRPTWRISQSSLDNYLAATSTNPAATRTRRKAKYVPQVLTASK